MNVMDVIGPVMVGPSSSHTAGAVRIGKVSRRLLGENVAAAHIGLYGSFLATGRGHGTDKALIAGLLGMDVDDMGIPDAFDIARSIGLDFDFYDVDLGDDAHPNSAKLELTGVNGSITLDTPRMEAYCGNVSANMKVSGDYPMLGTGATAISWSGNVSRVTVQPNWRTL